MITIRKRRLLHFGIGISVTGIGLALPAGGKHKDKGGDKKRRSSSAHLGE